jgi:hypothetical protein
MAGVEHRSAKLMGWLITFRCIRKAIKSLALPIFSPAHPWQFSPLTAYVPQEDIDSIIGKK